MPEEPEITEAAPETPAPEETAPARLAQPVVLRSRIDGYSARYGVLRAGEPVETHGDGTPLPDAEKRDLAARSEFLELAE